MAEHDVSFEFGGPLAEAEDCRRLVAAILSSGFSTDWRSGWDGHAEVVAVLEDCALLETAATLTAKDARSTAADGLASLCRELGLSYRISIGGAGGEGGDATRLWKPGMPVETTSVSTDAEIRISLRDVEDALSRARDEDSLDPLQKLVDDARASLDEMPAFAPGEGILVRLEALSDDEISQTLADGAAPGM